MLAFACATAALWRVTKCRKFTSEHPKSLKDIQPNLLSARSSRSIAFI
jgi:hypothetical protein